MLPPAGSAPAAVSALFPLGFHRRAKGHVNQKKCSTSCPRVAPPASRRLPYLVVSWAANAKYCVNSHFFPSTESRTDLSGAHENPRAGATDGRHCRA